MAVEFFPSTLKGNPPNATDDHQPQSTFAIRCTARTTPVQVGAVRWYAQGITVGTTVRPFFATREGVILSTGASVVCVAGWNNLPLTTPQTVVNTAENFIGVEQMDAAKYTYLSGADLELETTTPLKCLPGYGVWSYKSAAGALADWQGSGQNTGTWYGVDIVTGVPSNLTVVADHFPATGAVGATIGLNATPSGASGSVGYLWVQTGGPAATLINPTTATASFSPATPGTYAFTVTATDSAGSASASTSVVITAAPDTTPPSAPTGLSASAITKSGATINWDATPDAVGYRVYIGGVLYGTSTTPDKTIVGRAPDVDMFITVTAADLAGNWSAPSAPLTVHTLPVSTPPPAGGAGTLWVKLDSGVWAATGEGTPADPEWLFRPESYGARGDGVFVGGDVHTTAGSLVVTSASASFTEDDIGKRIIITDAGPTGTRLSGSLISSIVSVTDEHTINVGATAVKTQSDASATYGTDDSQAFLDMMLAVKDYHLTAANPHVKVELDRVCYVLGTKPADDSDGLIGTWSRAQVPLPVNPSQQKRKWVTEIVAKGGLDGATFTSWHQTEPQFSGAMLFSMIEVTNADYIPEMPISVIGGVPGWPDDWQGQPNSFNNTLVKVDGVRIMCPHNPGQIAIDFNHEGQYHLGTVSCDIFAAPHGLTGGYMIPQNPDGMGFRTNYTGYNDRNTAACLLIQGYYVGATVDEHCSWADCRIIYSKYGLFMNLPGGNTSQHGAWLGYASVEISDYPLFVATTGARFGLSIDMLDNEGEAIAHISDAGNVLYGEVNLFPSGSTVGPVDAKVHGATNLIVRNLAGGVIVPV